MEKHQSSLFDWPQQAPSAVLHCLADADFIHALENGPEQWWRSWQQQRLAQMLRWLERPDLSHLPVQRRQDYQALFEDSSTKVPTDHGAMAQFQSSGSIGVPVRFWRTELATRINLSHYWADHRRQGRDLQKTMAVITGTPGHHEGSHKEPESNPWLHPGKQLARNSPQFTMDQHARWICDQAPRYLATTPATLSSVISIIEMHHIKAPRIEHIMTSSHTVDPELRERTRRVFGASIRDRYSCEELGPIAFQCPESDEHYHVAVANVIVEAVEDAGAAVSEGSIGNILVTGLHQWATPALRYDLGDVAALHSYCSGCGATVPTLSHLMGRRFFLLHSPSHGFRHVRVLAEHWLACAPVREHRIVQTGLQTFRAEVVLDRTLTNGERQALLTMLSQAIGGEFGVELVQMNAIPWTSGKRHEFVGLQA